MAPPPLSIHHPALIGWRQHCHMMSSWFALEADQFQVGRSQIQFRVLNDFRYRLRKEVHGCLPALRAPAQITTQLPQLNR